MPSNSANIIVSVMTSQVGKLEKQINYTFSLVRHCTWVMHVAMSVVIRWSNKMEYTGLVRQFI